MHLRLQGTSIYKDCMDKIYKYGFWLLVIYVCLDISLYLMVMQKLFFTNRLVCKQKSSFFQDDQNFHFLRFYFQNKS